MLRTSLVAGALLCAVLVPCGPVAAANAGDIYVRNVSDPNQPGHETDPHLACEDIDLMADKLAQSHGTFTIDGQPPSGSQRQDYPATGAAPWSYPAGKSGTEVVAVISVKTLIADARKNGDAPSNGQGYHFKVGLVEDQTKHKTFWVACDVPTTPTPAAAGGASTSTTSTSTGSASSGAGHATTSSSTSAAAHSGSTSTGGVAGASAQQSSSSSSVSGGSAAAPGTGSTGTGGTGSAAAPGGAAAGAPPTGADPGPGFTVGLALLAAGAAAIVALLWSPARRRG